MGAYKCRCTVCKNKYILKLVQAGLYYCRHCGNYYGENDGEYELIGQRT